MEKPARAAKILARATTGQARASLRHRDVRPKWLAIRRQHWHVWRRSRYDGSTRPPWWFWPLGSRICQPLVFVTNEIPLALARSRSTIERHSKSYALSKQAGTDAANRCLLPLKGIRDMGIFSRFSDIINSNLNSILEKAEDPEKLVRMMIQEMEDTLVEVRSAAARAIADRKELDRKLASLEREARAWQTKAELALDKNREDLAKAALAEKARLRQASDVLQEQQDALNDGLEKLNGDIVSLESKLADAKARQEAIVQRHRAASKRLAVRKRLHDYRIDDALVRFEQFERRMDLVEGQIESYEMGGKKNLSEEISELESAESVERELAELKAQRARPAAAAQGSDT
jgi:phage shock protein A